METDGYSRAIRANGEMLLLHCWTCGTAHYVETDLFSREGLPTLICSNKDCRMSMLLVNELVLDGEIQEHITALNARARLWK